MVNDNNNRRLVRVAESIRNEVTRLLLRTVSDPRLAWVTVTDVAVSPDLKYARVFYVVTSTEKSEKTEKATAESLKKATPFIQKELGRHLTLRYTPKISFIFDNSFDDAARIDALIGEVEMEERSMPALTPEKRLAKLLSEAEDILVITHRNPDGDAIGSLLGFSRMLRLMGKSPVTYCPDPFPKVFSFLDGIEHIVDTLPTDAVFALTVSLDTADEGLWPGGLPPRENMGEVVVIDHHDTHGEIGDVVIRREASAVGEMLLALQKELVWPIDAKVAECLYTSIVADTGSFRYSNTTPETHRAAAELLALGAQSSVVGTALFESHPVARQRLLASVLGTLELANEDRFAYLVSTPEMLEKVGAEKADLDNIINFARGIDTVRVAAMFRLEQNGDVKVSFRSKDDWDVAEVAARFGGGGHRNAAGATLRQTPLDDAVRRIREAVDAMFIPTAGRG